MATYYKTTGDITQVTPKNGKYFELKELQDYVGGYIEGVRLNDGSMLYVNEEGMLYCLPYNENATRYANENTSANNCYCLVGDCIHVPFCEESDAWQ